MYPSFNRSARPVGKGINAPLDGSNRTALHIAAADKDEVSLHRLLRIGANPNQQDKYGQTPLFDAVKSGNSTALHILATRGGQVNHRDDKGRSLIDWAIETGAPAALLKELHTLGADFDASPKTKQTALHTAAATGRMDLFETLAALNLSVNARDKDGNTPLHLATQAGHLEAMQKLIDMGADANIRNTNIETPLYLAADKGIAGAVDILLAQPRIAAEVNSHANYSSGFTPLMAAAAKNHADIVAKLFAVGADVNQTDNRNRNSLYIAAEAGAVEAAKKLVSLGADAGKAQLPQSSRAPLLQNIHTDNYKEMLSVLIGAGADINATDSSGNTALHRACDMAQTDKIMALLSFGANPNLVNIYGERAMDELMDNYTYRMTDTPEVIAALLRKGADPDISPMAEVEDGPLHRAVQYGHKKTVDLLLQHNAKVDAFTRGFAAKTALHIAAEHGRKEIAEALLQNGANPLKTDSQSRNALHLAAHNGNKDIVGLLLTQDGIDINTKDHFGRTPLHHACLREKEDAAALLLSAGADADMHDNNGFTPLQLAVHMGNTDILPVFAAHFGDAANWNTQTSETKESLLHLAVRHGVEAPVQQLIALGADLASQNAKGESPLHLAIAEDNIAVAQLLLKEMVKQKIQPGSLRDLAGNTPLHTAVAHDNTPLTRQLIDHGADLSLRNAAGDTPLHIAVRERHLDVAEFLVKQKDINVLATDQHGLTALQIAVENRHERLFALLLPATLKEQEKQVADAVEKKQKQKTAAPKKDKNKKPPKPNRG